MLHFTTPEEKLYLWLITGASKCVSQTCAKGRGRAGQGVLSWSTVSSSPDSFLRYIYAIK